MATGFPASGSDVVSKKTENGGSQTGVSGVPGLPAGSHADGPGAPPAVENPPTAPMPTWQTAMHEIFALVLSSTILIVTVVMMASVFKGVTPAKDPKDDKLVLAEREANERRKDIMLYSLSLLGTVTGYYLGRVPAERRADTAQRTATQAQSTATAAEREVVKASATTEEAIRQRQQVVEAAKAVSAQAKSIVASAGGTAPRSFSPQGADPQAAQKAIARLDELLWRML